jgi:hypothetical protein
MTDNRLISTVHRPSGLGAPAHDGTLAPGIPSAVVAIIHLE